MRTDSLLQRPEARPLLFRSSATSGSSSSARDAITPSVASCDDHMTLHQLVWILSDSKQADPVTRGRVARGETNWCCSGDETNRSLAPRGLSSLQTWLRFLEASTASVRERTIPTERPPLVAWSARRIPTAVFSGFLTGATYSSSK
jgi:hypothetical protein